MPKVSVIIPVYNAEKYLRQCLDSVVNQTLTDIEIICVDDGSTDGSLDILNEYRNKDNRLKIVTQQNLHAGVARNTGIALASGEYVHFLDSDDWVEKDAYDKWYAIAKDAAVDVCICLYKCVDNETGKVDVRKNVLNNDYIYVTDFKQNSKFFIYNPVVPWNKIYSRKFLLDNDIAFDDLICANDRSFYFRVIKSADKIGILQEFFLNYRTNNQASLVGKTRLKNFDVHFASFETIWKMFLEDEDETKKMILDVTLKDFFNFYHKSLGTEFENDVRFQLTEYLSKIDFLIMEYDFFKCSWYDEFIELMNTKYKDGGNLQAELKAILPCDVNNNYKQRYDNLDKQYKESIGREQELLKEIENIHNSLSYRIGRSVTWFPRKVRGGIRCYNDHGAKYTINLFKKKLANKLNITISDKNPKYGLNKEKRSEQIIVSLTSFPGRINTVHKTIETLLSQTIKPDKVILWLAYEQFPRKEKELPKELLVLRKRGLSIEWCEDLKSYKKLIPALRMYPDDIIITTDDDAYYAENWLELLYNSYTSSNQLFIHCHRVTKVFCVDENYHVISANKSIYSQPSYLHKLVGLGGVLYPPHVFHKDILKVERFMELAPTNDDLWFWFMAILNEVKIKVVADAQPTPRTVEGSQDNGALHRINDAGENLFWVDFYRILEAYPKLDEMLKREYALQHNIDLIKQISQNEKDKNYYLFLNHEERVAELMDWYYRTTKCCLDIDNPTTYNEKIQWMKLYDNSELKTALADKFLVRKYVQTLIGEEYLVPLLGVYDSFDDIDFDILPEKFVIKANHGCGWNIIVTNKESLDLLQVKEKVEFWLNENYACRSGQELQYMNIEPRIIIEEYMENNNNDLYDYKVFCFDGKAESIMYLSERKTGLKMAFYDLEWKKLPFTYSYPMNDADVPKPSNLNLLIELSEKLAKGFPHVRVDFYILNDGSLKFGELTFSSANGGCKWNPPQQNIVYGKLINLPEKKPIPQYCPLRK